MDVPIPWSLGFKFVHVVLVNKRGFALLIITFCIACKKAPTCAHSHMLAGMTKKSNKWMDLYNTIDILPAQ